MSRSLKSSLAAAALMAVAASGMGVGAVAAMEAKPGYTAPRSAGTGPKKQPRKQTQVRQQAAEAKRQQRQARNLMWMARGGFSARRT
jgi:hypothetical protein